MGWTALADNHHERGDLADLTPDGDRLFGLLISFTNTPQRKGKFTRLDAAQLARSRKFPIDHDVALADLLSPDHPQIEEVEGGFQIIDNGQYHVTPQKSVAGKKGGEVTRDSGALAEARDKRWSEDDSLSRLKAGSKHSEDGSKLSPSPSPSPSPVFSNPTGVDVSLVSNRGPARRVPVPERLFVKVHRWALLGKVLDGQYDEVDNVLTEAVSDFAWLGADAIQDIIVGCLDGLTPKQRHGKPLVNLVRLITHDNSRGKGRSDGQPYPLASILGRAIEDYA
jgi:hypothetical protein